MSNYKKAQASKVQTEELCNYGCGTVAQYQFWNGKLCCSKHYNSCKGKRQAFSSLDHTERTKKSLQTRIEKGITKTSQIKGGATRRKMGHYEKLAEKMKSHWEENPWDNNLHCPFLEYKNTGIMYQGSYEYEFLEELEHENGIEWLTDNVFRGPSIWYTDIDGTQRLYISDFVIENTVYEIKSSWTWNKNGKDQSLEEKNKAKLSACVSEGYSVVLVLNHKKVLYEEIMD